MRIIERPPATALRPYVQLFWSFDAEAPEADGPPERITPDGIVELVFHLGPPAAIRRRGGDFARQGIATAVSQTRRYLEIRIDQPARFVAVRFWPWGAYHFFDPPVSAFADRVVDAAALWPDGAIPVLWERLAAAPDTEQRFALLEAFLLARLTHTRRPDVAPLIRAMWRCGGRQRIAALAAELGFSERSLERRFVAATGAPPKRFARLVRFQNACRVLERREHHSLTEVAYDCGYYDQAHFIGEFRALAGLSPSAFLSHGAVAYLEPDAPG